MARGDDVRSGGVLLVAGTRPELLKLAPVQRALKVRGLEGELWLTGQHRDLAPPFLAELGLEARQLPPPAPANCAATMLARLTERVSHGLCGWRPALVLVQGDTLSALAGGLAAAYQGVPVGHVEAGLRTLDMGRPFPEELHRQLLARVAWLHFAPTAAAVAALAAEQVDRRAIYLTGNTAIDSLFAARARIAADAAAEGALRARFPFAAGHFALATAHRRENLGMPMAEVAEAIARLAAGGMEVALPLHPNPRAGACLARRLDGVGGVHLLPPLEHGALVWLLARARLLLTDSGGLQEEAPALGLPTLVLRETTERPEAVECGIAELVGTDAGAIVAAAQRMLARPRPAPAFPFGDGHAGERIAAIVSQRLAGTRTKAA